MKNRRIKELLMTLVIFAVLGNGLIGCGNANAINDADVEKPAVMESASNNEETETEESKAEDKVEVTYTEEEDIYTVDREFVKYFDREDIDFVHADNEYSGSGIILNSIDIYGLDGFYAGYSKEDAHVSFYSIKDNSDWVIVAFAKKSFVVKADDFNANFVNNEDMKDGMYAEMKEIYSDGEEADIEEETNSVEKNSIKEPESVASAENASTNTATETAQTEQSAPATTTYSEEEVISIFRSTLESNGIQWYPSVYPNSEAGPSGGMGWGIENISMTDPYTDSAGTVEGFQFAGWNLYYLESQGASDGYVHLKLYSGTN